GAGLGLAPRLGLGGDVHHAGAAGVVVVGELFGHEVILVFRSFALGQDDKKSGPLCLGGEEITTVPGLTQVLLPRSPHGRGAPRRSNWLARWQLRRLNPASAPARPAHRQIRHSTGPAESG